MIGELAPKGLALQRPESTSLWLARPIQLLHTVFKWPITALNAIGNRSLGLIGLQATSGHEMVHSVEELRMLVTGMQEAGVVDVAEARIARRAFAFGDLTVAALMTPRTEMQAVPVTATLEELLQVAETSRHSQLPVYEGITSSAARTTASWASRFGSDNPRCDVCLAATGRTAR